MINKSSEDDDLEELLNETNDIPLQKILASFNQNSKSNASLPAKILVMTDHAVETLKFNIKHDLAISLKKKKEFSGGRELTSRQESIKKIKQQIVSC